MNRKKIYSLVILIMLALTSFAVIMPSAMAETPVTIWGYVRIDDVLTDPEAVELIFEGSTSFSADLVGEAGYLINFDADGLVGETGIFNVTILGVIYTADQEILITGTPSVELNLTVNTSAGPTNNPPYVPSDPTPADGATDIGRNADLGWTGGDPDVGDTVTYDVYFGTTSPPSQVTWNQTETTYDPGIMNCNTTYYWQIVAWDNHGAYRDGPIWSFTTEINNPPTEPYNPTPADGASDVDMAQAIISWYGGDPDVGDQVRYHRYFGTDSGALTDYGATEYYPYNQTGSIDSNLEILLETNTTYYWQIVAEDFNGNTTVSPIWSFTTIEEFTNNPPNIPSGPIPADDAPSVGRNDDLSWTGGDPDGDDVTYDIYFGTTSPPPLDDTGLVDTTYDPSEMSYSTPYYWQIIAWDGHGYFAEGPIWSFTVEAEPSSPPSDPPPSDPPQQSFYDPTADPGGPYTGFPDQEIEFNGTGSHDNDENGASIERYDWKFFEEDSWHNDTGANPNHTYNEIGVYNVTLRVHDDEGETDTATTTVNILIGNRPPENLELDGPTSGSKDTVYSYTASATDPDNNTMQYTIDWDDGSTNSSEFLENGTSFIVNHSWDAAGKYIVELSVYDNQTTSVIKTTVLIDAKNVGDIGYITDDDSDGTYDTFHGDQDTTLGQDNGDYLIDEDGDGEYDWVYDPITEELTEYQPESEEEPEGEDYTALLILVAFVIILGGGFAYYIVAKNKAKKQEQAKKASQKKKSSKKSGKK